MKRPRHPGRLNPILCAACSAAPFLFTLCLSKAPPPGASRWQSSPGGSYPPAVMPVAGAAGLPPASLASSLRNPPATPPIPRDTSTQQFTVDDLAAQLPRSNDGSFLIPLPLLAFSASDAAARQTMQGLTIETTASVDHVDPANRSVQLSRLLTRCCTADAIRHSITATVSIPGEVPTAGSWITTRGRIAYLHTPDGPRTSLLIDSFSSVPTPANPILR